MAVRASMQSLIDKTRSLIGDVSTPQDFTDQDIQDQLDAPGVRCDERYVVLEPRPTFSTSGILYNDYYAPVGAWEADVELIWGNFSPLTPLTSDEWVGHWTFDNQYPPVLLAGKTYDVYAAAAEMLERRIALHSMNLFYVAADGRQMQLNNIVSTWQKLRDQYLARTRDRVIDLVRADAPSGVGSGGGAVAQSAALAQMGSGGQDHPAAGPVSRYVPYITGE